MPVIPLDLNPGRSAFQAGDIRAAQSPSALAQAGEGLAQAGAQVSAEAARFAERYGAAVRQKNAANLTYSGMQDLAAAQQKWSQVPDSKTAIAGFDQDSKEIRDRVSQQSSDPEVQSLVLHQLTSHAIWSQLAVQSKSFDLEASQHRADIDQQLDGYAQQARTADPVSRASIVDAATASLKGSVAAGWMHAEQGEQRLLRFRDQVWGQAVEDGLQKSPRQTLAALDAGDYDNRLSLGARERLEPQIDRARAGVTADQYWASPGAVADPAALVKRYESKGDYNIGHGGADLSKAPLDDSGFPQWAGHDGSHAAGAYQFEPATWRKYAVPLGIHDFSRASQDRVFQAAFAAEGYRPWAPHNPALAAALGQKGDAGGALEAPLSMASATAPPAIDQAVADIERRVASGELTERVGNEAIAQLGRRYSLWRAATRADRATLKAGLEDGVAALAAGRNWDPPQAAIARLLPEDQADDVNRRIDEAREQGQAKNALEWASPVERAQIIQRSHARLDQTQDFARNQRYATAIDATNSQQLKALADDPALYVRSHPAVAAAWAKVDPNNPGPGTQAAIAQSLAMQAALGVEAKDQRILTKADAGRLAHKIAEQDPAQIDMPQELDRLAATYGRSWPQVFGETVKAGLPADYQVLATMDRPDQIVAAADFQRMLKTTGEKGGAQKLREAIAPDAARTIDAGLNGTLEDFRKTVRDPALYRMTEGAVQHLAQYYAYRGDDPGSALQKAYDGIVGKRWDFDATLRVPKGELATVRSAAQAVQDGITIGQLGPVPGNPQLTPAERQEIYLDAIRNGTWETNESDDGAVLMLHYANGGTAPATLAHRKPLEFKFADAPRLAAKATPRLPPPQPGAVP